MRRRLGRDRQPDGSRDARRLAARSTPPARGAADAGVRPGRRAGGEHDDVAVGRLRREQARPVERDEVGAERVDRPAAGAFGGGEEHAARRSRELAQQARPATTRAARTPARSRARAAPRPSRARRRRRAGRLRPRRAISSAPFGLVTTSQSYPAASTGSSEMRSISISGHSTTSAPSASSRATSGPACARGRVTITRMRAAPRGRRRARRALRRARPGRRPSAARPTRRPRPR